MKTLKMKPGCRRCIDLEEENRQLRKQLQDNAGLFEKITKALLRTKGMTPNIKFEKKQ